MRARRSVTVVVVALVALVAGCRGGGAGGDGLRDGEAIRLGYVPDALNAPAVVGIEKGMFAEALGGEDKLRTTVLKTGSSAVNRLLTGALDVAYVGPLSAIEAYERTNADGIRVVAGSTSGGNSLVVRPDIRSVDDLRDTTIATPPRGETQAIALRAFLLDNGIATTPQGGGDVSVVAHASAETLELFRAGEIDGAWLAEPWSSRLVLEGGAVVLVDELALWPDEQFPTAVLVARTAFVREHADALERLLEGHVRAVTEAEENPAEAERVVQGAIRAHTGVAVSDAVLSTAWDSLLFTYDPIASGIRKTADDAIRLASLRQVDLSRLFDLTLLNRVLANSGQEEVGS